MNIREHYAERAEGPRTTPRRPPVSILHAGQRWLAPGEVARALRVTKMRVHQLIAAGRFRVIRRGRFYYVEPDAIPMHRAAQRRYHAGLTS